MTARQERWTSDDGEVEIKTYGANRTATAPRGGDGSKLTLQLFQRPRHGANGWIGRSHAGDDLDVIVAIEDGGELLVAHTWARPWAAGTEADPRSGSREWRCARVIETKERDR